MMITKKEKINWRDFLAFSHTHREGYNYQKNNGEIYPWLMGNYITYSEYSCVYSRGQFYREKKISDNLTAYSLFHKDHDYRWSLLQVYGKGVRINFNNHFYDSFIDSLMELYKLAENPFMVPDVGKDLDALLNNWWKWDIHE